ncbi:CapA family protein [Virgisporangium aurantiacum]|uniref:Poly-gamma-glutamate biosynthesis protein n=1 Tax=Virgisporangium aurantiacum TaxID=175570 RepID=A0A8J3Z6Y6_9ACTN|nr:CapA family protein [Virgisporangium aurantiacum]GIJ58561.1 poly-gamma-glutamate biosynthesis protein [Virgisporangium aurantiacum]
MGVRSGAGHVLVILLAVGAASAAPTQAREPGPAARGSATPVDARPAPATSAATPPATAPARPRTLTVLGSGDVLLHSGLWRQAQRDAAAAGRQGYDFGPLFAAVRPVVAGVDLAICHLETPLGNPGGPFSGYPVFEVPPQVVPALKETGYDACSTASNHSLDRGEAGVRRTLDALDAAGVAHSGTHRSAGEKAAPTIVSANGVRVGLLSYTFSFNGIVRPADKPWLANSLDADAIVAEAARARAAGAEIVITSLHWGTEYQSGANDSQLAVARHLLTSPDIDLVLGHHAHVVQPFERIGDKWVAYGLGNHVSTQRNPETTRDGVLARMTFTEVGPKRWRVTAAEAIPTWMSHDTDPARLVLVPAALADPATPPALRDACARSLRRTTTAVTARGAGAQGLSITG